MEPPGASKGCEMDNVWLSSALWVGLALIASVTQRWIAVSIALIEIVVGAIAGNLVDLTLTLGSTTLPGSAPSC
jgi:hypothetical protein